MSPDFYNNTINGIEGTILFLFQRKKEWFSTQDTGGVTGDRNDSSISYRINDFYEIDLTTLKSKKSF